MLRAFKYRLYPTKQQQRLLEQQLEECRWLYNHLLAERRDAWEQRQESLRYYDQAMTLPILKATRPSLAQVNAQALQNVAVRIDLAFKAFFRRMKAGETPGYPRFRAWTVCEPDLSPGAERLQDGSGREAPAFAWRGIGQDHPASPDGGHDQDRHHQSEKYGQVVCLFLLRMRRADAVASDRAPGGH